MNYEESYLVVTKRADGTIEMDPCDDVVEAGRAYRLASIGIEPGTSVTLVRSTTVTIASAVRA